MAFSPVDPSRLQGEALDRWYRRSPDEIEQERQAAQARKYDAFFGRTEPAWASDETDRGRSRDQSAYGVAGDPQSGQFQLAAASQRAAAPGILDCPACHGPVPLPLPFPFPVFPVGPFFRNTPSPPPGGGSQPDRGDKKECDQQRDSDSQICGRLRSPSDIAICRGTASERYAYCRRSDGTIGSPHLETQGGRRP